MSLTTTVSLATIPDAARVVATTDNAAWTWGAWQELSASSPDDWTVAAIRIGQLSLNNDLEIELGIGVAGAEVAIGIRARLRMDNPTIPTWIPFTPPIGSAIPSGSRVCARLRKNLTGLQQYAVALAIYPGAFDSDHVTTCETASLPDAADGKTIVPNTTAWANSAWVEITSGLADPAGILGISVRTAATVDYELDLGAGGAGAEAVITSWKNFGGSVIGFMPIVNGVLPVAASTRLAVRLRKDGTSATNWTYCSLTYYADFTLNAAPIVDAGPDQTITGVLTTLAGSATDDGQPDPPGSLTYLWTQVSGPGSPPSPGSPPTVHFLDATDPTTSVSFDGPGVYVLRLTANDGALTGDDEVTITVAPAEPPFTPGADLEGDTLGHTWIEVTDAAGTLRTYTDLGHALCDPIDIRLFPDGFYGWRKDPRVLQWGELERALSDYRGMLQDVRFDVDFSDRDWHFRSLLTDPVLQYLVGCMGVVRSISGQGRLNGELARTLARLIISAVRLLPERRFRFECTDPIAFQFGSGSGDERQTPKRTLDRTHFPALPSDAVGKPEPIIYGEASDEGSATAPPLLTGDADEGAFWEEIWVCGYGPLTSAADPPTNVAVTVEAGGDLPLGYPDDRFGVIVTAVDASGHETDPDPFYYNQATGGSRGTFPAIVPTGDVTAGNQTIRVTWDAAAGADKYRVYLGYYYYGAQWLEMIEVDAPTVTVDFTAAPARGDDPTLDNITPGATLIPWSSWGTYVVTAVMADGETGPSQECHGKVTPYRRPTRIRWLPVAGALSYNVYRKPGGGIPSPPSAYDRTWSVIGSPDTLFDDDWADTGVTMVEGLPAAHGVVPVTYLGQELLGGSPGTPWEAFLVAGHACTAIVGLYLDGVRVDATAFGVSWLVPGYTGWDTYFGSPADSYRDLNGRRYTIIYGTGPNASAVAAGEKVLTVNAQGIETTGDGTGTLITKVARQALHFAQNFGFGDWETGAWLDSPTFPTDPAPEDADVLAQIDDDSFTAAELVTDNYVAGGIVGTAVIGAGGTFTTIRETLARFAVSGGFELGHNRKCQLAASAFYEDPALLTTAPAFRESHEINAGSFEIQDLDDQHWNIRPYAYQYDWARGAWGETGEDVSQRTRIPPVWLRTGEDLDAGSITNYGASKRGPTLELWFIRSDTIAAALRTRALTRTKDLPRRARWASSRVGWNVDLGAILLVTHTDGPGPSGWVDRPMRVVGHVGQPQVLGAQIIAEDVGPFFPLGSP